ncbi:hypothetical protein MATL_G00187690 [Megalops atlanticus]|uniref:Uncharacterized protein n=1 Tax=Megalops atlanticus TaxID=7932 RepID=A0A9D3T1I6_MEGAT|nr:hypothetical protein MATL_G00187690 [Megalops atlanticus]
MISLKGLDIHHSSTLPSILDTYLSPGYIKKDEKKQQKMSLSCKEEGGFLETSRSDSGEESTIRQKAALDQRHLEVYRNMHLLRDVMYHRYAVLLKEKIHRQRKEIKRHEQASLKPPENAREQRQGRVLGQKLPYCNLSHNDSHLKSLPKTSYYLIVDLQDELARRGCLKTWRDQEEFWSLVGQNRGTARLESRLKEICERMISSRPAPDQRSVERRQKEKSRTAPIVQITVDEGSHQEQTVLSEEEAGDSDAALHPQGKHPQEQDEMEQMFPKLQVPKFVTLQPGFLDQFKPSVLPELRICDPPQKRRRAGSNLKKLHLMHSLSLTNMATSQRMLDRNGHFKHWEEEDRVHCLLQYVFPADDSKARKSCNKKCSLPHLSLSPRRSAREMPAPSPKHGTPPPTGIQWSKVIPEHTEMTRNKIPEPLTLEEVCQQHPVKVIDHHCKTWTNYV